MAADSSGLTDDPVAESSSHSILPSDNEKIRQSVLYGSVFLALETEFFTHQALLHWLAHQEVTERTQVAYKAVSVKIHPNDQYLDDGSHFLVKQPGYALYASRCGLNTEIPDSRGDNLDDYTPIVVHIIEALTEYLNRQRLRNTAELILVGEGQPKYIQVNLATCYRARNFPHLRTATAHEINTGLVQSDWAAKFRYNDRLANLILQRIVTLQRDAPIYYANVGYQTYHPVIVKLNRDKLLTQLTRDELILLNSFFPNIVDAKILNYNDLAYKLALLGNDIAGYVLGFPVQNMIPNDAQIHIAISMLTEMGCPGYAEHIKNFVRGTYTPVLPITVENPTYSNTTDVLMEEIDAYVPFDLVSYQDGSYIYRFSRAEFHKLVESKKNPWTNDWLPVTVLSTIKARTNAAKELGLPPARPLLEMLDRIEKGTLFTADETPAEVPTNPSNWYPGMPETSNPITVSLDQLLPALLNGGLLQLLQRESATPSLPPAEDDATEEEEALDDY